MGIAILHFGPEKMVDVALRRGWLPCMTRCPERVAGADGDVPDDGDDR